MALRVVKVVGDAADVDLQAGEATFAKSTLHELEARLDERVTNDLSSCSFLWWGLSRVEDVEVEKRERGEVEAAEDSDPFFSEIEDAEGDERCALGEHGLPGAEIPGVTVESEVAKRRAKGMEEALSRFVVGCSIQSREQMYIVIVGVD